MMCIQKLLLVWDFQSDLVRKRARLVTSCAGLCALCTEELLSKCMRSASWRHPSLPTAGKLPGHFAPSLPVRRDSLMEGELFLHVL